MFKLFRKKKNIHVFGETYSFPKWADLDIDITFTSKTRLEKQYRIDASSKEVEGRVKLTFDIVDKDKEQLK